jgi:nucleoside-diphosphate-sugar epimerase
VSNVLVTGAGGYIGSVLIGSLLQSGHSVIALDRFFFGRAALRQYADQPAVKLVKQDVRDISAGDLANIDAIIDLAALSNDPCGDLDPELTYAINLHARQRLATMGKQAGVRRYILASSCSVYGHTHETVDETTQPQPLTVYAKSNVLAEQAVLPLNDETFSVTVLRNATVFGLSPRMRFDLVVNLMTQQAFKDGRIVILGGGRQWRPLVHVRDVANIIAEFLSLSPATIGGEVFNLGLENLHVQSIAYIVRECLPFPVQIDVAPDDADKRSYNVSFDKLCKTLKATPRISVAEGVQEIYAALRSGGVEFLPQCNTINWYRRILEAKKLISEVELNGRLL